MSEKPICIYHGGCADGFTAAWAVWKRFGDDCDYHPGIYQTDPPDVSGRNVIFVDFSYKRAVMLGLAERASSVLVLDHHKSAMEDLAPGGPIVDTRTFLSGFNWERHLQNAIQDRFEGCSPVYTLFDMERSGAGIAWDFFHPDQRRPALVNYVEDRDLWRFRLTDSRDINANVFSHRYAFGEWNEMDGWLEREPYQFAAEGRAIERKHHKDVGELVAELRTEMIIGGHWVPVANLPKTLTSDAGHLMCAPYASPQLAGEIVTPLFAACYWDAPQGRVFSLRSVGDFDVSEIARGYGGGGHRNAAGFTLKPDQQL